MEKELIFLCKEFLRRITTMYFKGLLTKEEFEGLCERKISFLKERGVVFKSDGHT